MYINESLLYNKTTGELIGLCDIGDINNYLLYLEEVDLCLCLKHLEEKLFEAVLDAIF